MSDQIVDFIQKKYEEKHERNHRYSHRAFAKSLDIESSVLSKILTKKRPLTFETANRILTALNIQISIKNSLLLTIASESNHAAGLEDHQHITLTEKELELSYKWHFYAVLSALEIDRVKPTILGISNFLNLDQKIVEDSVKILCKMGAIKKENEKLILTGHCYTTTNGAGSDALVKAHEDHIREAKKYLLEICDFSDYSGSTIAIPIEKLPEARRRIKEFRRSLSSWLGQDDQPKTDVYRLNIQFFPLGKL